MKIAITGAAGFLGWHVRCAVASLGRHEVVPLGRAEFDNPALLHTLLADCEAVIHLAGVNRDTDARVSAGNRELAVALGEALPGTAVRTLIHGNSIHSGSPTAFGSSKAFAADELARAAHRTGASFTDVLLPNLFGEGGRPHYNSVVATFCAQLASGEQPSIQEDKVIPLLHAQDAADVLLACVDAELAGELRPAGEDWLVSDVLAVLQDLSAYALSGDFPDLSSRTRTALFSTFQSFCFPARFPFRRTVHSDERGELFETARARRTDSLSFVSTTVPGAVRGQHFHRRKVERFLVIEGEVEIRLRRMITGEEVTFRVSGRQPAAVDMPTLWAHSLKNVGATTAVTAFWSNNLLDAQNSDTYRFPVYET